MKKIFLITIIGVMSMLVGCKSSDLNYYNNTLGYVENFMNLMFELPTEPYKANPVVIDALDKLFILHADHEQNCSTSTVRIVGSSQANLYSTVSAGISALWGPLHGGANQEVIEMLEKTKVKAEEKYTLDHTIVVYLMGPDN